MATKLNKSVVRSINIYPFKGKDRNRSLVVSLHPSGMISFRAKGTRKEYTTTLHSCFNLAFSHTIMDDYNTRLKTYKIKKNGGMRVKKPKKPFIPFKFV